MQMNLDKKQPLRKRCRLAGSGLGRLMVALDWNRIMLVRSGWLESGIGLGWLNFTMVHLAPLSSKSLGRAKRAHGHHLGDERRENYRASGATSVSVEQRLTLRRYCGALITFCQIIIIGSGASRAIRRLN